MRGTPIAALRGRPVHPVEKEFHRGICPMCYANAISGLPDLATREKPGQIDHAQC